MLRRVKRVPVAIWTVVRRRPWRSLVVLVAVSAAVAGGAWGYAAYQWRAGRTALQEGRPQDARVHLDRCLRVWPRDTEVHRLSARAARLSGDIHAAEAHLNRCLQIEGGATDGVQLEFLLLRVQTGEVDALAPVLFDAVEKGHPEYAAILETVARAYVVRLRYKPAYACLSRWIEADPSNAKPYHWRGWALERLNNLKGAREDYHRALELDPTLVPVRLRVAEMLLEDKQAPEALPHLEILRRQVPDDPVVQARMGICMFLQGRSDEARRMMEAAVVHLPHDPALLVALANLDLQEGKGVEAEKWLRAALEGDPSDTEALFVLGSALQFQGRTKEAEAALAEYEKKRVLVDRINDLLKNTADSPTAKADDYAEIGESFFQIGREKFGVYWLEQALEREPANQRAHRALAEHYTRKGDAARAAAHRGQLRAPDPSPVPPGPVSSGGKP